MIEGGCLCGKVRYVISGRPGRVTHCHCGMCRKQHGAAYATYGMFRRSRVDVSNPDGALTEYRSSPKVVRQFCGACGSSLFWTHDDAPEWLDIAIGTLDGEPERAPEAHIFTKHKAAWVTICDDLPRHDESIPEE